MRSLLRSDPSRGPRSRPWLVGLLLGAALTAVTACAAEDDTLPAAQPPAEPGFGHVHGLGVNPADEKLYAATHFGLWVADDGRLERVGDAHHDLMGFTVLGEDRFAASGHPLLDEDALPPHLGYIVSDDGGHTWQSVALLGEADFHALAHTDDGLYGYDASGGRLLHSPDGEDWDARATDVRLPAVVPDPDEHTHLLAAQAADATETDTELVRSRDGGQSWEAVDAPAAPARLSWAVPDRLFLVDEHARLHHSPDGGDSWTLQGRLPAVPGALVDHDGRLYADAGDAIIVSDDDGDTWAPYATAEGES